MRSWNVIPFHKVLIRSVGSCNDLFGSQFDVNGSQKVSKALNLASWQVLTTCAVSTKYLMAWWDSD